MIRKALFFKIFDTANMQRWNDKIRPVELRELDKQAHKMVIAYMLGKFEEQDTTFNWIDVVEGGLFEFLQRAVLTDLKPQIFYRIKEDQERYRRLNEWVFEQLAPVISPLGGSFMDRFRDYFTHTHDGIANRILDAAHFYATKWEFDIVERANPQGYEIQNIRRDMNARQEKFYDLKGVQQLMLYGKLRDFMDLSGQLRFQVRWSYLHRIPKTSVLGHMFIVAVLSYLFSLEMQACPKRCYNNYFTGLFHDLPEVLTRDIVHPVKKSIGGLDDLIKEYEKECMEKEVYGLIPHSWHEEIRLFTEIEFKSVVTRDGNRIEMDSDEINGHFNDDAFDPRDGQIVKAADHLSAFLEAYLATANGMRSPEFQRTITSMKEDYRTAIIGGVNLGEIYADFD
jgi:putative hydrolase of HD superfamily